MAQRGPAEPQSRLRRVELFVDQAAVAEHRAEIVALFERVPGVRSVAIARHDARTVEACLHVEFDPRLTSPAVLKALLAGVGIPVVAAVERPSGTP